MSRARERVAELAGEEEAGRLTCDNPLAVLEGRVIEPADPLPAGGSSSASGLLGRWLGRLGKRNP